MRLSNFPKWRLNISLLIILTISSLILLACGPSASETTSPDEAKASKSVAKAGGTQATSIPEPTAAPESGVAQGRDDVIILLDDEPPGLNIYNHSQGGRIHRENLNDPLGWFDKDDRELVALSPFTGWELIGLDTWHISLREGVKFHNGEPWNGDRAAWNC